jgi:hypothetical protein
MLGLSSRRLVVLLIVGLAAFFMTSCGGGGDDTTTTTGVQVVTTAPSGGPAVKDPRIGLPIEPTIDTPKEFVDVYKTQPIVVLFYVAGGSDDETVWANLDALRPTYGAYTFFTYDYSESDAYGDLASLLAVDYSPLVVMMDRQGVIHTIWSGFVDQGSLNQSLANLGRE